MSCDDTRETIAMTTTRTRKLGYAAVLALVGLLTISGVASAATSKELLDCQKQLESQVRGFSNVVQTSLYKCAQKVVECALADEIDSVNPTLCLDKAANSCTGVPAKVTDQASRRKPKVIAKCGLIPLAELEQFSQGLGFVNVVTACGALNVNQLVDCVFDGAQCSAERELFMLDPRAQQSLTTAGIAASFPCVAP